MKEMPNNFKKMMDEAFSNDAGIRQLDEQLTDHTPRVGLEGVPGEFTDITDDLRRVIVRCGIQTGPEMFSGDSSLKIDTSVRNVVSEVRRFCTEFQDRIVVTNVNRLTVIDEKRDSVGALYTDGVTLAGYMAGVGIASFINNKGMEQLESNSDLDDDALDLEWAMVIDQPEIVGENSDEYDELRDVLYEDREYLIPLYDSYSHIFRFEDPKPQKD